MIEEKKELPQIIIKCITTKLSAGNTYEEYSLTRQHGKAEEDPITLSSEQFHTIRKLGEHAPNLMYTSDLTTWTHRRWHNPVSGEQQVAEFMHRLSQPDLLSDLIKPEVYGTHTVGYRLEATVKIVREEIDSPVQQAKSTAIGRLLHSVPGLR